MPGEKPVEKTEEITILQPDAQVCGIDNSPAGLEFLVDLVKEIRPARFRNYREAESKFRLFLEKLKNDKKALSTLQVALRSQFINRSFVPVLIQSGMPDSRGFLQELIKKIKHKILPPLIEPENFLYVLDHVFYKHKDHIWITKIDRQLWIEFFQLIGLEVKISGDRIIRDLNKALHILNQRVVTLGLEKEIMGSYLNANYQDYSFFLLDQAVQTYLQLYKSGNTPDNIAASVKNIVGTVEQCSQTIKEVSEQRIKKGTSLSQTYLLIRIEQHLERLLIITDILDGDRSVNEERFLDYFFRVINYEKTKNSIRGFLSANFAFLSLKVTEHGGTRGKKYITTTRREYWGMIKSSMGGGFIVSFTAIIKNLITKLPLPPFWLGFLYSVNYTVGFQIMHETRTTLATKQPAYTASAIAASVDYFKEYRNYGLNIIAITIARTARTQLASFFGNLIVVFPLAYGLAALYHAVTGNLLLDNKVALHTLEEQHPYYSLSILYACFTGFFLFLSGLIGGYVENGINYGDVSERLKNNPAFKNHFSTERLDKITNYVTNHLSSLVSNISLGFFLGMAGFLGKTFGLPFDIRHITIASGNAAIAYYTTGNAPGTTFLATVLGGILLIGFFNFLVSFVLAFHVAVRSRGVRLKDYPDLLAVVIKYFIKFPLDFFFPPKSELKRSLE